MRLVEKHIIKKGHSLYKEIDGLCFLSKNLYNKANYIIRQEFIKNWKSFFASIRDWRNNPQNYKGRPLLPRYKNKTQGRNILTYTSQAISKKELKNGVVHLSGTTVAIQTRKKNIKQVRIIPRINCYVIEIVYEKGIQNLLELLLLEKTREKAMQGLLANPEWMKKHGGEKYLMQDITIAKVAINIADVTMKALEEEPKQINHESNL